VSQGGPQARKPRTRKNKAGSESTKGKLTKRETDGKQLTFNLLLLRLESLARLLAPSPQVLDSGLLLLEGLAQVLVRDAKLDQLPVEPRDLVLSLLEGGLRPLERGALLLKPTQRLLPRQVLPLERSPGFGESSLLLLELGLRLLLTVNSCIKVRLDLQADKSPVVVKGPFFPRVVNPRCRIRGTMCNTRIQSCKAR
jgi:hypothetical protein